MKSPETPQFEVDENGGAVVVRQARERGLVILSAIYVPLFSLLTWSFYDWVRDPLLLALIPSVLVNCVVTTTYRDSRWAPVVLGVVTANSIVTMALVHWALYLRGVSL